MSTTNDALDAKLDAWLADWPAPERDENAWDDFANKLDQRIAGLAVGQGEESWLAPPLPAEPGEGDGDPAVLVPGGAKMSEQAADPPQDLSKQAADPPQEVSEQAEEPPPRKSLKDFAQRVSVAPPSAPKSTATPMPKASETPMPVSGRPSSPSLRASASRVSHPPEARDSDSGLVDLNAIRKSAASVPDTGAQPGESDLFEDDAKAAVAAKSEKQKVSMLPIVGGGVVAVLAIAAAAVLVVHNASPTAESAALAPAAPAMASGASDRGVSPRAAEKPARRPTGLTADGLEVASDETLDKSSREGHAESATRNRPQDEGKGKASPKKTASDDKPATGETKAEPSPNDLAGAMATAVGAGGETRKNDKEKVAGPAADPGSIPEAPSQGAIQGAVGSVKGAAKGCVAGLDGPSRATITFGSSGAVSSVSVSGAAAGKPAAGCIQSALRRARVGPFKRKSFTVGVTIRP